MYVVLWLWRRKRRFWGTGPHSIPAALLEHAADYHDLYGGVSESMGIYSTSTWCQARIFFPTRGLVILTFI